MTSLMVRSRTRMHTRPAHALRMLTDRYPGTSLVLSLPGGPYIDASGCAIVQLALWPLARGAEVIITATGPDEALACAAVAHSLADRRRWETQPR